MQRSISPVSIAPSQLLWLSYPIYPKLGIVSVVLGTFFAITLIPDDPTPSGALVDSALAMSVGLVVAPLLASLKNPIALIRAEHCLILAPIYWLLMDMIQGAYDLPLKRDSVINVFIAISIFVIGIWLSVLMKPWALPKPIVRAANYSLSSNTLFRLILVFFILGISKYVISCRFDLELMAYYLTQNRWTAPWARGTLGGWDAFLDHMSYFGYLLPTLTTLYAVRCRKFSLKLIISIFLSLLMVAFLAQGGGRRVIGVVIGAAILCWILEQQKLSFRQLVITFISIVLLMTTMQFMLEFRGVGVGKSFFGPNSKEFQYGHIHVDDNFLRLGQVIDLVPNQYPFVYEKQIIYILARPIPRVLWPSKPVNAGFDLAKANGRTDVSYSSSVIAEWYISLGWPAILFGGWFYGRIGSTISLLLIKDSESANSLVYSLLNMALFAGTRSMLDLVIMNYSMVAWILISTVMSRQKRFPRLTD